jgi:hypothetical protein
MKIHLIIYFQILICIFLFTYKLYIRLARTIAEGEIAHSYMTFNTCYKVFIKIFMYIITVYLYICIYIIIFIRILVYLVFILFVQIINLMMQCGSL